MIYSESDFVIKSPITVRKVIDSEPCDTGLADFLNYIVHKTVIVTFEEEIPESILADIFSYDNEWFDYAQEMGWVFKKMTAIDPDKLYRHQYTKHLYKIVFDDVDCIVIIIGLSTDEQSVFSVGYDELESASEHKESGVEGLSVVKTIEALSEYFPYVVQNLVKTELELNDIIYKKYRS